MVVQPVLFVITIWKVKEKAALDRKPIIFGSLTGKFFLDSNVLILMIKSVIYFRISSLQIKKVLKSIVKITID